MWVQNTPPSVHVCVDVERKRTLVQIFERKAPIQKKNGELRYPIKTVKKVGKR